MGAMGMLVVRYGREESGAQARQGGPNRAKERRRRAMMSSAGSHALSPRCLS